MNGEGEEGIAKMSRGKGRTVKEKKVREKVMRVEGEMERKRKRGVKRGMDSRNKLCKETLRI